MADDVWIIGAAMLPVRRYPDRDVVDLASDATLAVLADAQTPMRDVGVLAVGCQFNPSVAQRLLKQVGQTGVPAFNVSNACATGASAMRIVHMAIKAGEADIGLAVGAEQMGKAGLLGPAAVPRSIPEHLEPHGRDGRVLELEGLTGTGVMPGVFAMAGMDYARRHPGVGFEQFARVAEKNHAHSVLNPLAQYRKAFSLEQIMQADMVAYPNTVLMCCPTGDCAAAVVLVSEQRLRSLDPDVRRRAVKVSAAAMTTDPWVEGGDEQPDVNTLSRLAADRAYEQAGLGPADLDLVELHDCFATAELLHYDNLRLCEPGGAGDFIDSGAPWRDGRLPVNVSGGLISKGHPIGATGVANVVEVVSHLRGEAGDRQVAGARVGLTHVIGLGSTCAVHILERRAA
jgi:acetyl-CoA acyltransferase